VNIKTLGNPFFECDCIYCKTHTYVNIIGDILYNEIPKNATSLIKTNYCNQESDILLNYENIKNYNKALIVIRHPVDRFASLISHYFQGGRKKYGNSWLRAKSINGNNLNDKIDLILNEFDSLQEIGEPHHFNSQVSFIPNVIMDISTDIIDISEINRYFQKSEKLNQSKSKEILFTTSQKDRIKRIYNDDYEFYKTNLKNK
jgi:hypothetical protein